VIPDGKVAFIIVQLSQCGAGATYYKLFSPAVIRTFPAFRYSEELSLFSLGVFSYWSKIGFENFLGRRALSLGSYSWAIICIGV
jgi:hypothetical protein